MQNNPIITVILAILGIAILIWLINYFTKNNKTIVINDNITPPIIEEPVMVNRPVFQRAQSFPSTMPISNGNVNVGARVSGNVIHR